MTGVDGNQYAQHFINFIMRIIEKYGKEGGRSELSLLQKKINCDVVVVGVVLANRWQRGEMCAKYGNELSRWM